MGKVLIVRHGETEWNATGRIQGHTDVTLSEKGRWQARLMAGRLADVPIRAAYCSDLKRATETAKIILGERDIQLNPTPRLREYHKGVFEGLTAAEMQSKHPELFSASLLKDLDFAPTGGESIIQTSARIAGFLADVKQMHGNDPVLIVGHGGSLRAVLVTLLGLPLEATWRFIIGNCSLTVIETYPDNTVLTLYNDTSHLNGTGTGENIKWPVGF